MSAKETVTSHSTILKEWKRMNALLDDVSGKKDVIRLKETTPKTGEIFLDFEEDATFPETSDPNRLPSANSISVVSSSYISDSKYSKFGKKSAYFSGRRNQIHLKVGGSHFFGSHPEPFTITVPILISEQSASSVLLERSVFIKGKKYGFSLEIEGNKLVLYIHNLILKQNGGTVSEVIHSRLSIPRKEWQIISIFFDPKDNRIILFQDGYETGKYEANGADIASIGFSQADETHLIIGKSYFGNIDGFHIHKGEPYSSHDYSRFEKVSYSDASKFASQEGAWIYSPVYHTKHSQSNLVSFQASYEKPTDTQIAIYFRGHNQKFTEDGKNVADWVRLEEGASIPKIIKKFQYHQWKVWLRSDPQGKSSPSFSAFSYELKELQPPSVPTGFRISQFLREERSVCFAWNSNHEREVQEDGGYLIYYGVEPDRMIGTLFVNRDGSGKLSTIDGKQDGNDFKNLKYCANEETLISNIYIPDDKNVDLPNTVSDPKFLSRLEKRGVLFQPGLTYYFKISAYNRYYDEFEGRDQRSRPSHPISVSFPKEVSNR